VAEDEVLRLKSGTDDLCIGSGSLAQQGFLTPLANRGRSEQANGAASTKWQSHFVDTLRGPNNVFGRRPFIFGG